MIHLIQELFGQTLRDLVFESSKECSMANNKNPNETQPGEKAFGKFHL